MAHRLSSEAEAELDGIWYYIATESGSPDIADRFIDSLTDHFYLLSHNPYIGRRRDEDLRPGMEFARTGSRAIGARDLESVIDGFFEFLPAPDVPFSRIHGRVTKEKLNLLEFATSLMAEAGASATKIVGCQMVNADSFGVSLHGIPDYVSCHSFVLQSPILRNSSEHLAFSHSYVVDPSIY